MPGFQFIEAPSGFFAVDFSSIVLSHDLSRFVAEFFHLFGMIATLRLFVMIENAK